MPDLDTIKRAYSTAYKLGAREMLEKVNEEMPGAAKWMTKTTRKGYELAEADVRALLRRLLEGMAE